MDKSKFVILMTNLSKAFRQKNDEETIAVYYEFLKDVDEEALKFACKNIIKNNKYFPTVAEIIAESEVYHKEEKFYILEFMKQQGYFHESEYGISEYDKATNWLTTGVIPGWFKEDMEEYAKMYKQKQLNTTEQKRLEYE